MAATLSLLKLPIISQKPHSISPRPKLPILPNPPKLNIPSNDSNNPHKLLSQTIHDLGSATLPLSAVTLPFLLDTKDALAVGGEFGILEGRSFALIHPIVMGGLFVYTLWAGYLGWQWRRVRTIQNEITELKKQVKPTPVTPDGTPVNAAPSPVEVKIQQLTEERKELLKGSYRDRHFNAGSILLGFGVFEAVFGAFNTWTRTGKLFPGPHLFAGAGCVDLTPGRLCCFRLNRHHGAMGRGSCPSASDAEGKRDRKKSSHCVECIKRRTIYMANPHRI